MQLSSRICILHSWSWHTIATLLNVYAYFRKSQNRCIFWVEMLIQIPYLLPITLKVSYITIKYKWKARQMAFSRLQLPLHAYLVISDWMNIRLTEILKAISVTYAAIFLCAFHFFIDFSYIFYLGFLQIFLKSRITAFNVLSEKHLVLLTILLISWWNHMDLH